MQTSYQQSFSPGVPGMIADMGPRDPVTRVSPFEVIPFGLLVSRDSTKPDTRIKLPTTSAEVTAAVGIALKSNVVGQDNLSPAENLPGYPAKTPVNVMRKGRVWVKVLDAVVAGTAVYARWSAALGDVSTVQKGAFGNASAGVAQVETLTNTGADNTTYTVTVNGVTYSVSSTTSTTPTTVTSALKTAMASDPTVNVSGTATLILTAKTAGNGFVVSTSANITTAHTTPNAAAATVVPSAVYQSSAAAGGVAIVEINLP